MRFNPVGNRTRCALRRARRGKERATDETLSDVELHILRAVALGRNNQQIADELYLSRRTLESRRQQMQQKIGVTRISQLVRYALTHGLLDDDD